MRAALAGLPLRPARGCSPRTPAREQAPWTLALRAIRVIVRSARSALARKHCKPRSLFFVYAPSVCLRRCTAPTNKVKTASNKCSVRVQSGTKWSDPRELTAEALRRSAHSALARKHCKPRSELKPRETERQSFARLFKGGRVQGRRPGRAPQSAKPQA